MMMVVLLFGLKPLVVMVGNEVVRQQQAEGNKDKCFMQEQLHRRQIYKSFMSYGTKSKPLPLLLEITALS